MLYSLPCYLGRRGWLISWCCWLFGLALSLRPVLAAAQTPRLQVRAVAPDVFVFTSYRRLPGMTTAAPANGLVVRTSKGALLIDTTWDPEQAEQLLRWVADSLHQQVRLAIITHAHDDRTGGLAVLRAHGIRVYSGPLTTRRYQALHPAEQAPTAALKPYTLIRAGRTRLELFFPGPAHTPDNLVAWLPRRKVLFAGCLAREEAATTLGNLDDANLKQWPTALRTVLDRYHRARIVVPGHGRWGGPALLTHTQTLLRETAHHPPSTTAQREQMP